MKPAPFWFDNPLRLSRPVSLDSEPSTEVIYVFLYFDFAFSFQVQLRHFSHGHAHAFCLRLGQLAFCLLRLSIQPALFSPFIIWLQMVRVGFFYSGFDIVL